MSRKHRVQLALALLLLVMGAVWTESLVGRIREAVADRPEVLVPARSNEEPRHVLSGMAKEPLDGPILRLEIPKNADEFVSLTPAPTRGLWVKVLLVDFLFIAGYVILFLRLPFEANAGATLWEQVGFLGMITGAADIFENAIIQGLLGASIHSDTGIAFLSVMGAAKWMLFFLTCRGLSIALEHWVNWRWVAVWLRATATGGSWAALLAVIGLPARPLLTLMFYGSALLLLYVAIQRLRGVSEGPPVDRDQHDPRPVRIEAASA
jgi:hypothetical protein